MKREGNIYPKICEPEMYEELYLMQQKVKRVELMYKR